MSAAPAPAAWSARKVALVAGMTGALIATWPLVVGLVHEPRFVGNGTDLYSYQLPARRLVQAWLHDGSLHAWNPYVLGGTHAHAAMQFELAYPPTLAATMLAGGRAVELLLALHVAWLALGAAFLVEFGAWRGRTALTTHWHRFGAATAGAATAAGCGPVWGHLFAGHLSFIAAWSWSPWIWLATRHAVANKGVRAVAWASLAFGMQALAGHPQATVLSTCGLAAYLLAHAVADLERPNSFPAGLDHDSDLTRGGRGVRSAWARLPPTVSAALVFGVVVAVGIALAGVQWWPSLAVATESNRSFAAAGELALSFSAPATSARTLVDFAALGGPNGENGAIPYHETTAYIGVAGTVLACLGVVSTGRATFVLAACGAACFVLSLGSHGGVLPVLVDLVPALGSFRVPGRWLAPASLLVAVLAAQGVMALAETRFRPRPAGHRWTRAELIDFVVLAALAVALFFVAATAGPTTAGDAAGAGLPAGGGSGAAFALAGALVTAAGFGFRTRRNLDWCAGLLVTAVIVEQARHVEAHAQPQHYRAPAALDWSAADIAGIQGHVHRDGRLATAAPLRHANWGGAHGIAVAGGYEPTATAGATRLGNLLAGRAPDRFAVNFQVRRPSPWLDRAAVTHLLHGDSDLASARAFSTWPVVARLASGTTLRANPGAMSRVAVPTAVVVETDCARALIRAAGVPRDTVVVEAAASDTLGRGRAVLRRDDPGAADIEADMDGDGLVVLRDQLSLGWTVTVDGRPATALHADGLFRAVAVARGRHVVQWRYRAPGLGAGALLSGAALLAVIAVLSWPARRRPLAA
jgi:hypothetical protein